MEYKDFFINNNYLRINQQWLDDTVDNLKPMSFNEIIYYTSTYRMSNPPAFLDDDYMNFLANNINDFAATMLLSYNMNEFVHFASTSVYIVELWQKDFLTDTQRVYILQKLCAADKRSLIDKILIKKDFNIIYLKKLIYLNPGYAFDLGKYYWNELDYHTKLFILFSMNTNEFISQLNEKNIYNEFSLHILMKKILNLPINNLDLELIKLEKEKNNNFLNFLNYMLNTIYKFFNKKHNLTWIYITLFIQIAPFLEKSTKTLKLYQFIFKECMSYYMNQQQLRLAGGSISIDLPEYIQEEFMNYFYPFFTKSQCDFNLVNLCEKMLTKDNYNLVLERTNALSLLNKLT